MPTCKRYTAQRFPIVRQSMPSKTKMADLSTRICRPTFANPPAYLGLTKWLPLQLMQLLSVPLFLSNKSAVITIKASRNAQKSRVLCLWALVTVPRAAHIRLAIGLTVYPINYRQPSLASVTLVLIPGIWRVRSTSSCVPMPRIDANCPAFITSEITHNNKSQADKLRFASLRFT